MSEVVEKQMTMPDLYSLLCQHDDIIIIVPGDEVHRIRKGISSLKSKQNAKLKDAGLPADDRRVEYKVLSKDVKTHTVKLQIYFDGGPTVTVKEVIIPDGEL